MIPGASLASTIKVLAGLGPLGQKVLKQNGISEIDPKKNYPSIIRLKIFDEVRERFGDDALHTIGIEQGLLMLSMLPPFGEFVSNSRSKNRLKLKKVMDTNNFNMIENTLPGLKKLTNEYLGQFRSNELQGGINFERLSENTWHFKTTLAQPLLNWKFGIGNYSIFLMSLFSDIFDISMDLDKETSEDISEGWSHSNYFITYKPTNTVRDLSLIHI